MVRDHARKNRRSNAQPNPPPPTPPQQATDDNEDHEHASVTRGKKPEPPINVSQCRFEVICITKFGDKELVPDVKTARLGEFKVHEYNAKAMKAVHQYVEKNRLEFELEDAIATVKGMRLSKQSKTVDNPSDWDDLEATIRHHMEQRIKNISVNYTVTYSKTRRCSNDPPAIVDVSSAEEDSHATPARNRRRHVHIPHFNG
jgi:hypothetical protein